MDSNKAYTKEHSDLQSKLVGQEFSRAKDYAHEYEESDTPIAHFFNTRLKRVSGFLSEFESGKVLDLGCGPGIIGNTFRDRPIEYYGVDVSEDMIRICTESFGHDPNFRFSLGKIEALQFPASYFDVVLCLGAFEYVMDGQVAIREIVRVLKHKGTAIITMHNAKSPYRVLQRNVYWKIINASHKLGRLVNRRKNNEEVKSPARPKAKIYSETSLRHLLTSEELEIVDVLYYDFNLFFSPLDVLFPRTSVFLSRRLEFLCRSRLKTIGTGFILKCRKI